MNLSHTFLVGVLEFTISSFQENSQFDGFLHWNDLSLVLLVGSHWCFLLLFSLPFHILHSTMLQVVFSTWQDWTILALLLWKSVETIFLWTCYHVYCFFLVISLCRASSKAMLKCQFLLLHIGCLKFLDWHWVSMCRSCVHYAANFFSFLYCMLLLWQLFTPQSLLRYHKNH